MDVGQLLLGLAAIVGAIFGAWNGLKAWQNTRESTRAAQELAERVQDLSHHESIITRQEAEINRLVGLIRMSRDEWSTERAELLEQLGTARHELEQQLAACRRAISATVDAMTTLQSVVGSEVARSAAASAITAADAHLNGHGDTPPGGASRAP